MTYLIMFLKITNKSVKSNKKGQFNNTWKKACHSIKNNNTTELNYFRKELTKGEKFGS